MNNRIHPYGTGEPELISGSSEDLVDLILEARCIPVEVLLARFDPRGRSQSNLRL